MNLSEFNTELAKLVQRALIEGVNAHKLSHQEMVGSLRFHEAGVVRWVQDSEMQRLAHAQRILVPRVKLPPNGG